MIHSRLKIMEIGIFIYQLKKLHLTKPLLCFRMFGVNIYNETIKIFS
mgnify:CR=1 FL=1